MYNKKSGLVNRAFSVVLALLMVLSILPITAFASTSVNVDSFTVCVNDSVNNADINDASIEYKVLIDQNVKEDNTVKTNEGEAVIAEMKNYEQDIADGKTVTFEYSVSADGYVTKTGKADVTDVNDNIDVKLEKKVVETVPITVNKNGSGTVKINNEEVTDSKAVEKDSTVELEVTPAKDTYIKKLVIGGETKSVEKGKSYRNSFKVSDALTVEVTFVKEYTVSIDKNAGGSVKLDEDSSENQLFDEGTKTNLTVSADEGYQILSVSINGEDETVTDTSKFNFNKELTVNSDIAIKVEFVKVYTVKVSWDKNGNVSVRPALTQGDGTSTEGTVVVKKDGIVSITATPSETYRVSSVKINGEEISYDDNRFNANKSYKWEQTGVAMDYEIEITFAPILCKIDVNAGENGSVTADKSEVNYGESTNITITANKGYCIDEVKVNGEDKKTSVTRSGENTYKLSIENITSESNKVSVSFKKYSEMESGDYKWDKDDAIRSSSDGTFVFNKDAAVVFSTEKNGIELIFDDKTSIGGYGIKSVEITDTETVKEVIVYKNETEISSEEFDNLKIVIDKAAPNPKIGVEEANENGYYNSDFNVTLSAKDSDAYSGISKLEYWVYKNGETVTDHHEVYSYKSGDEILQEKSVDDVKIDAEKNNSDNVKIVLKVTDLAGNENEVCEKVKINTTAPTVNVEINGNTNTSFEKGYYTQRTATVTITDRGTTFDANAATDGIKISGKGIDGNEISLDKTKMISKWDTNGDTHTAYVKFDEDANYDWSVSYQNKAGKSAEKVDVSEQKTPYKFTVDKTSPSLKLTYEKNTWSELLQTITFGIWSKSDVEVTANAKDDISPIKSVSYHKYNGDTALGDKELDELYNDGKFTECENFATISSEERFVIYFRAEDYAGNYTYVSSNGIVVDKTAPQITLTSDVANENGYYNKDVKVNVGVDEMSPNCSGIKNVYYEVINGNEVTQSGNLYNFDVKSPTKSQFEQKISGNITVYAEKNNSDNIKVIVKAVDNAGNQSESSVVLNINKTNPTISVKFDNNDLKFAENERGYFNANRTATVTITDRFSTFDAKAATDGIVISAKDINGEEISLDKTKMISKWDTNGDTHTAYVKFDEDANYDWSVSYQNKAGKSAEKVDVSEQKTPYKFTVDKTSPSLKLTYEKNTWSELLQTITFGIWSKSDVEVTANAKDDISPIKSVSYHKYNGDTALGDKELDELYNNGEFQEHNAPIKASPGEQAVIYGRVEDYAGNYTYVSSNGIIADNKAPEITFDVSPKNKYGKIYNEDVDVYNGDVDVTVSVKDVCSGIKSINYKVYCDENVTQEDTYEFNITDPTKEQLETEISKLITVEAEKNNSDNVKVVVTATDNAGNKTKDDEHTISLVIDKTPPEINVKYNSTANNGAKNGYYTSRTATVTVTERSSHFDGADATKGIIINAVDAKNNKVSDAYKISGWTTVKNDSRNPDKDTHTATIKFEKDANYTFAVSYTDKAGNANDGVDVSGQSNPYKFTVDKTSPTGSLKAKSAEGQETEWSELRKTLTFGFWSKKKITVTGSQNDKTSPIAKVEYYKVEAKNATDGTTPLTKAQLDNVTSWAKFSSLEVRPNEQCAVYVKITDYAGNYTYISTNGLIADNKKPREESVAPQVTVNPQQPLNGFYKGNVKVSISVNDPLTGGTYSGLKEVSYRVYSQNILTQEGTLYSFNKSNPKQSDLRSKWTGSITVDSAKNNSNDVRVVVYAKDNAANDSEGVAKLKIDTTAPRIDVSYDNNSADSNSYFKAGRTARIVVTERNFNPDDVVVKITNTDGNIPRISNWTKTVGTGNQDDTRWTATIPYTADGDYHFSIAYTDLAGNKCSGENYATGTVAAKSFTMDKTAPTITVSYDNNSARNGNYYKADRTATVTIIEHNFDVNRVNVSFSAGDKKSPNMSGWSSSGDQHTATIAYSRDGYYSFDISVKDKAGNDSAKFNTQSFYIDKTAPTLEITGVKNNSAYSGDILPVVSYSDDNYDDNNVSIKLVGANRDNVDLEGYYDDQINGKKFIFYDFEKEKKVDDIYTLTATLTDKAGNTSTKSVVFSANRFGSTYAFDSATKKLNGAYSKSVKDIVVTETNVNKLNNIKITLFKNSDTIKLKNGTDYRIDVEGGNGKWYKYVYTIFAKNFSDDGVYRLSFHSEDAAGNISENTLDTKNKEIRFGVDKTKPNVVLDNLESGQTYPLEKLKVSMIANDNLLLNSVVVYLDNYDKAYKTWDAKEIADILGKNGEFTFDVSGNSTRAHKMKVVCTDAAGNKITKEIKDFYVTTNLFIRYYNNKLLFFGSIAGFLLIVGVIVYAIVRKKKAK
ncbi:MAG: Ig-like domain repeat protein [Ruminococcus sp.]